MIEVFLSETRIYCHIKREKNIKIPSNRVDRMHMKFTYLESNVSLISKQSDRLI